MVNFGLLVISPCLRSATVHLVEDDFVSPKNVHNVIISTAELNDMVKMNKVVVIMVEI